MHVCTATHVLGLQVSCCAPEDREHEDGIDDHWHNACPVPVARGVVAQAAVLQRAGEGAYCMCGTAEDCTAGGVCTGWNEMGECILQVGVLQGGAMHTGHEAGTAAKAMALQGAGLPASSTMPSLSLTPPSFRVHTHTRKRYHLLPSLSSV